MDRKILYGVAINDSDYVTSPTINGVRFKCPFYAKWSSMIRRCYSDIHLKTHPSYEGCSVCDEWMVFSNFKKWMEQQDWEGKELDKDLLIKGNKVYSPETCCFLTRAVNSFMTDSGARRGKLKIGVTMDYGKFKAHCRNPFKDKVENLGHYKSEDEAHRAWRARKIQIAQQLAMLETDERIISALICRYK